MQRNEQNRLRQLRSNERVFRKFAVNKHIWIGGSIMLILFIKIKKNLRTESMWSYRIISFKMQCITYDLFQRLMHRVMRR